jgi:integral membrane protein (TIGR00529 family)
MIDIFKLLGVLALIVFLLQRKWNLGLVLILASLLLGVLFSHPLLTLAQDMFVAATSWLTLRLVLIVVLILTLGEILRQTAQLDGMVHAIDALVPDTRVVFALVPALIGLLPMVGGAMFSAPMVNHIGDRVEADAARKTYVNYWFRHIWEYIFPLYPSFLLGAALMGLSTQRAASLMWPLTLSSVVAGTLFGLTSLSRGQQAGTRDDTRTNLSKLVQNVWPIALVLLLTFTLGGLSERAHDLGLDLIASLLFTLTLLALINRTGPRQIWDILLRRIRWNTVAVILGAMVFQHVLETTEAVRAASLTLTGLHIPIPIAIFAVPFIAGLLSGLGAAAFAIGFPIIMPLVGGGAIDPGLAVWAWAGGFLGVMLSPVHLCLALTRDYFGAEWGRVYRLLVPSVATVTVVAGAILIL